MGGSKNCLAVATWKGMRMLQNFNVGQTFPNTRVEISPLKEREIGFGIVSK